jgi:acyl-CoA synthetase (AMP-forming)/AMP-acid ligase II
MTGAADLSLGRWLPERAALTPDRVAIEFGDRRISYADLAAAAAGRATAFAAAGLKPGDRVATPARNCPEQVEVFFACAMTGLVLVPLNWRLTAPELGCQLDDADPAVLLTEPSLEARCRRTNWPATAAPGWPPTRCRAISARPPDCRGSPAESSTKSRCGPCSRSPRLNREVKMSADLSRRRVLVTVSGPRRGRRAWRRQRMRQVVS